MAIVLGVFLVSYLPDGVYGLMVPDFDKQPGKGLT